MAAIFLLSWLEILNFTSFVNALIWPNDQTSGWFNGAGLCDIEAKILVAQSTGLVSSTLCILRGLARVMNTEKMVVAPTKAQRRRALAVDLAFCLGIPLVTMLFHYVVQPNRYAIAGISGCRATQVNSWLSILLLTVPALVLALCDLYYAGQ